MTAQAGTLYLVATPIGNLEDITARALRILSEADIIACEDTRHTGTLLHHFGIRTKMLSYHEHNEGERAAELVELMAGGKSVAVVSDAGTPAINDPGFRIVRLAVERGLKVVPVPGATAFVAALVASGLPTDQFFFGGFLPARAQARRARLLEVRDLSCTLVFYETPHRIAHALRDALEILGEREAAVARELTKLHEEMLRGRLSELLRSFELAETTRGEMVVLIDRTPLDVERPGDSNATGDIAELVGALEREGHDPRAALKRAARALGLTRDEAYRRLVAARALEKNRE